MNDATRSFISSYLNIEVAYDDDHYSQTRELLKSIKTPDTEAIERGFHELIKNREWSTRDYALVTHVDFDTEDELYKYLGDTYNYLFKGASFEPVPPAP